MSIQTSSAQIPTQHKQVLQDKCLSQVQQRQLKLFDQLAELDPFIVKVLGQIVKSMTLV